MAATLDFIGLVTRDIGAARRFYALLDIAIPEAEGEDHFECPLPNGMRLAWDTLELIQSIDPDWEEPKGHRMGLAFQFPSPAEVDATYASIVAAGFVGKAAPWDAFWGQRYARVVDPDGNVVDLYASLTSEP